MSIICDYESLLRWYVVESMILKGFFDKVR